MSKEETKKILYNMYNVSHETFERLEVFVSLVQKWNKIHNLVSKGEQENLWQRHVLDSAQLISCISDNNTILDIGSGGGFPGIIIALLSNVSVILVERNRKKSVFLSEAKRILSLDLLIKNCSVEETYFDKVDTITSRGVAKISRLLEFSQPYLKQKVKFLLLKGKEWDSELVEAEQNWHFNCKVKNSITNSEGKILILSDIRKK